MLLAPELLLVNGWKEMMNVIYVGLHKHISNVASGKASEVLHAHTGQAAPCLVWGLAATRLAV